MPLRFSYIAVCVAGALSLPSAISSPLSVCNAAFTFCGIPENIQVQFPGLATAGDVVVTDSNGMVSDVFRISNNFINTGGGTGLGTLGFLFSADDSAPLPDPSTYSRNVIFIPENPSGYTSFVGNGTLYILGAPEPRTFSLMVLVIFGALARRAARRF